MTGNGGHGDHEITRLERLAIIEALVELSRPLTPDERRVCLTVCKLYAGIIVDLESLARELLYLHRDAG